MSVHIAVIAPSGVGKSSANGVAAELLPAPADLDIADQLPLGSGEGIVEVLFDVVDEPGPHGKPRKVRRQVRHNAFIYADEGETLGSLSQRKGATLGPVVRTLFTGGTLGNTNASEDRKRIVPAGQYAYGVVCGFQDIKAGALLDDADGGTPQRFAWARAEDPETPDDERDWPGPLDWERPSPLQLAARLKPDSRGRHLVRVADEIASEVRSQQRAKLKGEIKVHQLDAHRVLLRLKIAGLLALLDDRVAIDLEDWRLALLILSDSDATRARVIQTVRSAKAQQVAESSARNARRQVDAHVAVETRRTVDAARKVAVKVWNNGERTRSELYREMKHQRDVLDDALDQAAAEGWVVIRSESGQGADKVIVAKGERKPA